MEEKIKNVMASVFMCDVSTITADSSQDTIVEWDSLRHMNLIVALEEEFSIVFSEDEMVEMLSFKIICDILKSKK